MSPIEYLYQSNPEGLVGLARNFQIPFTTDVELIHNVHQAMLSGDEEFLTDLAEIHPDRDLILFAQSIKERDNSAEQVENKSNCCGAPASAFSGFDANTQNQSQQVTPNPGAAAYNQSKNLMPILIGGFAFVSLIGIIALATRMPVIKS